jgi:hypothetical protein
LLREEAVAERKTVAGRKSVAAELSIPRSVKHACIAPAK